MFKVKPKANESLNELDSKATIQNLIAEPLELLKVKVLEMLRANTDPKWQVELTKLKTILTQAEDMANTIHKKLGNIPLPMGMYESKLDESDFIPNANYLTPDKAKIDSWSKQKAMQWLDNMYDKLYDYQQRNQTSSMDSTNQAIQAVQQYLIQKGILKEAASQEAYALHRLTDIGQDAAQNFIEANPNVNLKKLMSDLVNDKAYRYIVRDIVKGTADKVYVKQFAKKYGELAESTGTSKSVTELVESIVTQTILEMYQPVDFDPSIHKTLEVGAVDYELDPTGEIIYAYMPFKEETENAVTVPFKKEYIESYADVEINSQDDLDSMDQSAIDKFVKNIFKRSDKDQILKKVIAINK